VGEQLQEKGMKNKDSLAANQGTRLWGARTAPVLCVSFGAYAAHRVRGCSVTSEMLGYAVG
jgi:hypothetical protein